MHVNRLAVKWMFFWITEKIPFCALVPLKRKAEENCESVDGLYYVILYCIIFITLYYYLF